MTRRSLLLAIFLAAVLTLGISAARAARAERPAEQPVAGGTVSESVTVHASAQVTTVATVTVDP